VAYEKVLYEVVDQVAVIRLNEPATLNAMSVQMGEELLHALRRAPNEARAIVLGSVGRAFCSGANLGEGGFDITDPDRDVGAKLDGILNPVVYQMRLAEVPVITAVNGAAVGVGCGFALAGDLIIAGQGAYFYQAFAKVGLSPDGGSSYLLTKAVGRVRAMELMLLGSKLPAPQALDWGLINRVAADDAFAAESDALLERLANGPTLAYAGAKRQLNHWLYGRMAEQLEFEAAVQQELVGSPDFAEGVAAFVERRPAVFRGR